MQVVDIANEIYLENASPKNVSIPAIAYWIRSNVGKLNSLLYEDFWINPTTLEIIHGKRLDQYGNQILIGNKAAAVLKVMFKVYMTDLDIRNMIYSATTDTILKANDQEFVVEKLNKSELLKTLTAFKKDTLKELQDIIHTYRSFYGAPSQVAGDDTVPGHYCGPDEWGYTRNFIP